MHNVGPVSFLTQTHILNLVINRYIYPRDVWVGELGCAAALHLSTSVLVQWFLHRFLGNPPDSPYFPYNQHLQWRFWLFWVLEDLFDNHCSCAGLRDVWDRFLSAVRLIFGRSSVEQNVTVVVSAQVSEHSQLPGQQYGHCCIWLSMLTLLFSASELWECLSNQMCG